MAKHNEVRLYGLCREKPTILVDEATGDAVRCVFTLITIRGIKDFGENVDYAHLDKIRVLSFNKRIIEAAKKIEPYTMIEVKGSFNTRNVKKAFICSYCGEKVQVNGSIAFVNPIFIDAREKVENDDEAVEYLKAKYELSNAATVIGMLCRDPSLFTVKNGSTITTYQMAVMRKYKVLDENTDNTVDFPWIKSYGKLALSDIQALKKGSYVFVDGVIQAREIIRHTECPFCGRENEWDEHIEELVPYAVEYLRDSERVSEITVGLAATLKSNAEKVATEKYVERKDEDKIDFDVNKFIEDEVNNMHKND